MVADTCGSASPGAPLFWLTRSTVPLLISEESLTIRTWPPSAVPLSNTLMITTSPGARRETVPFACLDRLPGVLFHMGCPASPGHVALIHPRLRYRRFTSSGHCHSSPARTPLTYDR